MHTDTSSMPLLFWLHIKKSGGQSTRALLQPNYKIVDRRARIRNFPDSSPHEWNDVLNNYRVPLGKYQFRRCLYAKSFLYGPAWNQMTRFAFSRDPLDRCISAFFYLESSRMGGVRGVFARVPFGAIRQSAIQFAFDRYLSKIEEVRDSASNSLPHGLHFATHTAPVWPDITDDSGNNLLTYLFDLGDFQKGLELVRDEIGLTTTTPPDGDTRRNQGKRRVAFSPSKRQVARVEELYEQDFVLHYEKVLRF